MCCGGKAVCLPMSFSKVHRMTVEDAVRLLANCATVRLLANYGCDLQEWLGPMSMAERILADRRVEAALKNYASLQSDCDEFDGDRRSISTRLWDAKVRIVELVAKHLRDSPPRRKAG